MSLFDDTPIADPARSAPPGLAGTPTPPGTREGGYDPERASQSQMDHIAPDLAIYQLSSYIAGTPAAQGSKRGFVHKGTGKVVLVEQSKRVRPWRTDVRNALTHGDRPIGRFDGAVSVDLVFVLTRPKRLPKSKPTPRHATRPDADKLTRAMFDAITSAGVWADDGNVDRYTVLKRYAEPGEPTGCYLTIRGKGGAT